MPGKKKLSCRQSIWRRGILPGKAKALKAWLWHRQAGKQICAAEVSVMWLEEGFEAETLQEACESNPADRYPQDGGGGKEATGRQVRHWTWT